MTRTSRTAAVILVGAVLACASTGAAERAVAAEATDIVSLTATPNAGKAEVMYTVPSRSRFLVKRACIQHTAMTIEVGKKDGRLTYGPRGCTTYEPGFVVAGGEKIVCDNASGLERSCALVGVLETMPPRKGPRVRFYDLR